MSEAREGSADGLEASPPPPPPEPAQDDGPPYETPFLVWLDGLPVSKDFNFETEYVLPCQEAYPDFLKDRWARLPGCVLLHAAIEPVSMLSRCLHPGCYAQAPWLGRLKAVAGNQPAPACKSSVLHAAAGTWCCILSQHACSNPPAAHSLLYASFQCIYWSYCCRSFLADRHDLWDVPVPAGAPPHLTWGVLAFRTFESGAAAAKRLGQTGLEEGGGQCDVAARLPG